jgi:RNA polymerase sigma-70 factor, ECF subfamily
MASTLSNEEAVQLVRRVGTGETQALERLYSSYAGRLLSVIQSILRSRAESEEVLQEVFLELWKRARTYDTRRGGVTGWLTVLARTRAIDRLRSRQVAERASTANPFPSQGRTQEGPPTPLQEVEQRQDAARVRDALQRLPQEQRTVLELSYFHGLSQTEVARHCNEPLGTVKTRMRLAMEKLMQWLSGTPGGGR